MVTVGPRRPPHLCEILGVFYAKLHTNLDQMVEGVSTRELIRQPPHQMLHTDSTERDSELIQLLHAEEERLVVTARLLASSLRWRSGSKPATLTQLLCDDYRGLVVVA